MGNCVSSSSKRRQNSREYFQGDDVPDPVDTKNFFDPFSKIEPTDNETHSTLDQTAPLSPDTLFMNSPESNDILSPLSSEGSRAIVPATSPHKNRALHARLQKSKQMRMAYESPGSVLSDSGSTHSRTLTPNTPRTPSDLDSMGGGLFTELEQDSAVLCTALSRTTPTLARDQPPLHIAMGMDSGSVVVQELKNDNRLFLGLDESHQTTNPKLGLPVCVQLATRVRSLDFSPSGEYLAVGGDDGKCHIYRLGYDLENNLVNLEWVAEIERIDRVYAVQFSPDSKYLAVGGFDGTVAIIPTKDIENELRLEAVAEIPSDGLVFSVDWSPDSKYMAIGGSDKCCTVVDCSFGWRVAQEIRRNTTIQNVKWYPTGKYLAIASADTVAIVVGRDAFAIIKEIDLRMDRRGSSMYGHKSICWSPNGNYLVVCSGSDHNCTLYETKKFSIVHEISRTGNITSVVWGQQSAFSVGRSVPNRFLVVSDEDRKVAVYKDSGIEGQSPSIASLGGDDMSTSASSYFSTRGDWTLRENAFRDVDDIAEVTMESGGNHSFAHDDEAEILCVAFSKGNKSRPSAYFATSADDGVVVVRSCTDWKVIAEIQLPDASRSMVFSNGSRYLALACNDSNVYISDTTSNWELVAKIEFDAPISAVSFSGKGNERLAVGSLDGTMAFLVPQNGFDFAGEVEDFTAGVTAVDWSATNLAVGREDGTVAVYDTARVLVGDYSPIAELRREGTVSAVSFGVSARFLAVGDASGMIGVYSSKGDWVLCHQVQMESPVSDVSWCSKGRHLAYASDKGVVKVTDTIFWNEIREAEIPSQKADTGSAIPSLCFSQDGNLLAFSRGHNGFGVEDVAAGWDMSLNLLRNRNSVLLSDPDSAPLSSTTGSSPDPEDDSSDEEVVEVGVGKYEV